MLLWWSLPAASQPSTTASATPPDTVIAADIDAPEGLEWLAMPIIKFNSDTGLVYGAQLLMTHYVEDRPPWDWRLKLKLRHSTTDRHQHTLLLDAPHSFNPDIRCTLRGDFLKIADANYVGIGNESALTNDAAFYQFTLLEPRGSLMVRYDAVGDLFVGAGVGAWFATIDAPEEGLLNQERPLGWDGGWATQLILTLGYDSRDHEVIPRNGYFAEAYLKPSLAPGNDTEYLTLGTTHRAYLSPARWLVFAQRLMFEHHVGDVPLPDLYHIGGSNPQRGIGGVGTQRGFIEGRFLGQTRVLSNTEIRGYLPPLWRRLTIGTGPFVDVSRVIDDEEVWDDLHVSGGGEVSFNWKETFIFRVNYAVSSEDRLLYIQGRHMF